MSRCGDMAKVHRALKMSQLKNINHVKFPIFHSIRFA